MEVEDASSEAPEAPPQGEAEPEAAPAEAAPLAPQGVPTVLGPSSVATPKYPILLEGALRHLWDQLQQNDQGPELPIRNPGK